MPSEKQTSASQQVSDVPKYVSEFIGTYLLVLTVCCNVMSGNAVWAATSIASVLMVSIYALGAVSGAHFNPAVTFAITLSEKMPGGWSQAAIYMVVQILGGTCAGCTSLAIFGDAFNLQPGKGYSVYQAGIVEIIYTFMLCFVVLNTACAQANDKNQYFGLAIGFVIVAGGYAGGAVSGGAFNPAVAFGIDIPSAHKGFGYAFAYLAFEFVGAALAAIFFRIVRAEDFKGIQNTMPAKLTSEFLGTFMLVVTVGLNVLTMSPAPAFSIAASLMCMIYALGSCSGAHFNPAVTLAIVFAGRNKITVSEALSYMAAQVAGGVCAGIVYTTLLGSSFQLAPNTKHTWGGAAVAEIIFTAVLCFVVLSVATTKQAGDSQMFGLAIGSCVTVGGFAIGSISGGSLNPAVSFGIDSSHALRDGHFANSLAYTLFEFVGAGIAAGAFYITRPAEYVKKADVLTQV